MSAQILTIQSSLQPIQLNGKTITLNSQNYRTCMSLHYHFGMPLIGMTKYKIYMAAKKLTGTFQRAAATKSKKLLWAGGGV